MTIATILVPLSGASSDRDALRTALAAVTNFGAHVTALLTSRNAHERARLAFTEEAERAGAAVVSAARRHGSPTASYREAEGRAADVIAEAALFADLVVFAPDASQGALRESFIRILMASEKPVLLAAGGAAGAAGAPARIAIGWDGGLASARALTAAAPFLERAARVELLVAGAPAGIPAAEAAAYLALRGVDAKIRAVEAAAQPVGEALLAAAADADLLVLGGYGHNRLVESLLGGTTAHILAHARIPVLMAH